MLVSRHGGASRWVDLGGIAHRSAHDTTAGASRRRPALTHPSSCSRRASISPPTIARPCVRRRGTPDRAVRRARGRPGRCRRRRSCAPTGRGRTARRDAALPRAPRGGEGVRPRELLVRHEDAVHAPCDRLAQPSSADGGPSIYGAVAAVLSASRAPRCNRSAAVGVHLDVDAVAGEATVQPELHLLEARHLLGENGDTQPASSVGAHLAPRRAGGAGRRSRRPSMACPAQRRLLQRQHQLPRVLPVCPPLVRTPRATYGVPTGRVDRTVEADTSHLPCPTTAGRGGVSRRRRDEVVGRSHALREARVLAVVDAVRGVRGEKAAHDRHGLVGNVERRTVPPREAMVQPVGRSCARKRQAASSTGRSGP